MNPATLSSVNNIHYLLDLDIRMANVTDINVYTCTDARSALRQVIHLKCVRSKVGMINVQSYLIQDWKARSMSAVVWPLPEKWES